MRVKGSEKHAGAMMGSFDRIRRGQYPARCWFAPGARLTIWGCTTQKVAAQFASALLSNGGTHRGQAAGTVGGMNVEIRNGQFLGQIAGQTGFLSHDRLFHNEQAWNIAPARKVRK